jgi:ubiquinone/menaquinone biosynthesis C-methylase UbiE
MRRMAFGVAVLYFRLREILTPPARVIREAGILEGGRVLDYGCGLGSHALAAAELVGPTGQVFAADVDPLAVERVRAVAAKRQVRNIKTILTDCDTGLEGSSLDVVLFYDTLHVLADPAKVLRELHRVLRPGGTLSFSDHHLDEQEVLARVPAGGLFALAARGLKTYTFRKEE